MRLSGLQKLTLLDYPGKTAATVFVPGCDFRCPFCQNKALVDGDEASGVFPDYPLETFFELLEKRHGLLDGVCITGGEPLLQNDIADFCARIRREGYLVKLDTNGSFPDRLRMLLDAKLVDYVAMDMKSNLTRYGETIGRPDFDTSLIAKSVNVLRNSTVPFEFRTTVVRELHTSDDLEALARSIPDAPAWYLQSYVDSDTVIAGRGALHAYTPDQMHALLHRLQTIVPTVRLRGI